MSERSSASTSISEDESSSSFPTASSKPSNSGSPARSSSQSGSSHFKGDSPSLTSFLRRISKRRGRGRSGSKGDSNKAEKHSTSSATSDEGASMMSDGKTEENTEVTADMESSSVETKSGETPATSSGPSRSPSASTPTLTAISETYESNDVYGTALHCLSTSIQTLSSIDPSSTIPNLETGKRYQEMFDKVQKDQDGVYKKLMDYLDKKADGAGSVEVEKDGKGEGKDAEETETMSEASTAPAPSSPSSEPSKSESAPPTDTKTETTTCALPDSSSSPPADNKPTGPSPFSATTATATEEKSGKKDNEKTRSLVRQSPKKEKNLPLYKAQLLPHHRQTERKKKGNRKTARRRNERVDDFDL